MVTIGPDAGRGVLAMDANNKLHAQRHRTGRQTRALRCDGGRVCVCVSDTQVDRLSVFVCVCVCLSFVSVSGWENVCLIHDSLCVCR